MPKKGEKMSLAMRQKISDSRKGQQSWNQGQSWNEFTKLKMSVGRKGLFNWVESDQVKGLLKRDYAAAEFCLEQGLYKPAIILYAGVIEAMLVCNYSEDMLFNDLIEKAHNHGLVNNNQYHRLHILRDYRNYVHIIKESKSEFTIDRAATEQCKVICDAIIMKLINNNTNHSIS